MRETDDAAPVEAAARAPDGPPMTDGVYTFQGCEGEGACLFQNWRSIAATPLLADSSSDARVIATLSVGEWVHLEEVVTRLIPERGIVRADTPNFRAGEVVYALQNEGEGYVVHWRRGEYLSVGYDDPVEIDWQPGDAPSAAAEASLGAWARVTRASGQVGWVHFARGQFECTSPLAGDEGCRD